MIRSVQRGVAEFEAVKAGTEHSVAISDIDPSKSFALVDGYGQGSGATSTTHILVKNLGSSVLNLWASYSDNYNTPGTVNACWQVVEFY